MSDTRDRNVISVWFWLFAMIVMVIPIVNIVMMFVWAFSGENQTWKNYFRALIILFVIGIALAVALAAIGLLPSLVQQVNA